MKTILALTLITFLIGCSSTLSDNKPVKEKYLTYISAGQSFPIEKLVDINGKEVFLNNLYQKS